MFPPRSRAGARPGRAGPGGAPRAWRWSVRGLPLALWLLASIASATGREPIDISADQAEGGKGMTILTGHVVIRQGTAVITSDSGIYDRDHHHQSLQGNVRLVDQTLTVTALTADNYEDDHKVILNGNISLTDTSGTLQANQAIYYRSEGQVVLTGNVRAHDRKRTLTSDRMVYFKSTRLGIAEGNVVMSDEEEQAVLKAPVVRYNRDTREVRVPAPSDLQVMDEGKPTHVVSDSMTYDSLHVARAYGHVHISRDSLNAESGQAVVYRDQNRAILTSAPRASDSHGSTEGDTLEMFWNGNNLRRLVARGKAKATYRSRPSSGREETSEATGDQVDLAMEQQQVRLLTVTGNAREEFHSKDLNSGDEDINTTEGDSLAVHFKDNEARLATVYGGRNGRYQTIPGSKKKGGEDVSYTASRIDYDLDRDRVYLRTAARLEYKDLVLDADSVDYDVRRSVLTARGNPRLKDPQQELEGEEMGYDLKHEQGSVIRGRTNYASGIYTGRGIRKVGDNVMNVRDAEYTTCDLADPHFHVWSAEMKIYLHDKVVMKPVVLFIRELPVLPLPFYVFPIKEGRHSGILFPQFDIGLSNTTGRFVRSAGYYWAANDYMDLSAYGDYYQTGPRVVGYLSGRYKVRYLLEGSALVSVSRDFGSQSTQWQVQGSHQQQLTDRMSLSASADFVSDAGYLQDPSLGRTADQRVSRNLHSLLALSQAWDWGSLNLALDRNQNLAVDPTDSVSELLSEQLPSIQFTLSPRTIGKKAGAGRKKAFLPGLSSTYVSFSSRLAREVHETHISNSDRYAIGSSGSISDNRRVAGWLNLVPSLALNHVLVDHDALGNKLAQGLVWSTSLRTSATFYGTLLPKIGPLQGLRHVFTPSISYSYQPEFTSLTYREQIDDTTFITTSRFPTVAGIGLTATKQSRMNIDLANTIQVKWKKGTEVKRLDNFINLDINTSYDFLARSEDIKPWTPVNMVMRLSPGGVGGLDASAVYDPYRAQGRSISQLNFSTSLNKAGRFTGGVVDSAYMPAPSQRRSAPGAAAAQTAGQPGAWTLGLSYSYTGSALLTNGLSTWFQSQRLNAQGSYTLSPNWRLTYSNQFDLSHGMSVYQQIGVERDLHCWQASFTRTFNPGYTEYYFRIGLKNRPEISYQGGSGGLGNPLTGTGGIGSLFQ